MLCTHITLCRFTHPRLTLVVARSIWFALVTPLGCTIGQLFSTSDSTPAWRVALRVATLVIALVEFVAHVLLANW